MRLYITLLVLVLTCCKVGKNTTSSVKKESFTEIIYKDSINIIEKILRNLDYDFEYSFIEWSCPDSSGKQYKVSEAIFKGSAKVEEKVKTEITRRPVVDIKSETNEKKEIKKGYPWYIKYLVITGILAIIYTIYILRKRH